MQTALLPWGLQQGAHVKSGSRDMGRCPSESK